MGLSEFFSIVNTTAFTLHYLWLTESTHAEPWIQKADCKLYLDFWLRGGLVAWSATTPLLMLFKGQLYFELHPNKSILPASLNFIFHLGD